MRKNIKSDIKVVIFVLASLIVLIWGFNFLKGNDFFTSKNYYYLKLKTSNGLDKGGLIYIQGVPVGSIGEMILDEQYKYVVAKLNLKKDLKLPQNTLAQIFSPSIMAAKALELIVPQESNSLMAFGDTISSEIKGDMFDKIAKLTPHLDTLLPTVNKSMNHVESITGNLDNTFNTKAQADLQLSIANISAVTRDLAKFTSTLSQNSVALNNSLKNVEVFTSNLNKNNQMLNQSIADLSKLSSNMSKLELDKTLNQLNTTVESLNTVVNKMNSKDGTIGMLLNDKKMYDELNVTLLSLSSLMTDLQSHPSRYINFNLIGRKAKCND